MREQGFPIQLDLVEPRRLCIAKQLQSDYIDFMSTRTIDQALEDLAEIRSSLNRAETFRGYRSASILATSLVAWIGCLLQSRWVDPDSPALKDFLSLWIRIALFCALVGFGEVVVRYWRSGPMFRHMTRSAIGPMIPALLSGLALTFIIAWNAPAVGWMLPGLWSIVFGLGVSASARFLPKLVSLVALYFIVIGLLCIVLATRGWAYSPWLMGVSFGGGQMLSAAVLYWSLERGE